MSSLGKGYTSPKANTNTKANTSNQQTAKSKSKGGMGKANQEERPAEFGRSGPSLGQAIDPNRANSITGKSGGERRKQPARQALSISLRGQVFKGDHYQCRNCEASPLTDKKVKLEIDHILAVSRGGTNDPHNLQTLCRNCNQVKKASLV